MLKGELGGLRIEIPRYRHSSFDPQGGVTRPTTASCSYCADLGNSHRLKGKKVTGIPVTYQQNDR